MKLTITKALCWVIGKLGYKYNVTRSKGNKLTILSNNSFKNPSSPSDKLHIVGNGRIGIGA